MKGETPCVCRMIWAMSIPHAQVSSDVCLSAHFGLLLGCVYSMMESNSRALFLLKSYKSYDPPAADPATFGLPPCLFFAFFWFFSHLVLVAMWPALPHFEQTGNARLRLFLTALDASPSWVARPWPEGEEGTGNQNRIP